MSYSDYLEKKVLDHIFGYVGYVPPSTIYIALSSGSPGEDGSTIAEPPAGSYARVGVTNNKSYWSGASLGPGSLHNVQSITFPAATAAWGLVDYFAAFDQATTGNMMGYGSLLVSKNVTTGDSPFFGSGTLILTMT